MALPSFEPLNLPLASAAALKSLRDGYFIITMIPSLPPGRATRWTSTSRGPGSAARWRHSGTRTATTSRWGSTSSSVRLRKGASPLANTNHFVCNSAAAAALGGASIAHTTRPRRCAALTAPPPRHPSLPGSPPPGCYFNLFRLMAKCGVLENLLLKEHTHTFCNTVRGCCCCCCFGCRLVAG